MPRGPGRQTAGAGPAPPSRIDRPSVSINQYLILTWLKSGEVQALLGRNGAGKPTLIRLPSGVETPDAGDVVIDGELLGDGGVRRASRTGCGHGVPGTQPGARDDRGRKPLPQRMARARRRRDRLSAHAARGRRGARRTGCPRRSRCAGGHAATGGATTGRDRPGGAPPPPAARPGRAHQCSGGRGDPHGAVGRAQHRRLGCGDHLRQSPAGRDPPGRRGCHRWPRRAGHRHRRRAGSDLCRSRSLRRSCCRPVSASR
jgi:energy-coupling factor transporter ATP-binding protein EcfA2